MKRTHECAKLSLSHSHSLFLSLSRDAEHANCGQHALVVVEEEEEEEEEEEGLFRANAVNEEDPERDRATQVGGELTSNS